MRTWISIYVVAVHGAAKTNWINAHHASLCHLWRSSAGPSLAANKLERGCIYPWILLLFSSVQILQFKLFDIHVNSAPRTTNLQQNITKQTLAPYFSGESFNYLNHCFISSHVVAYLVCFEQVLCWRKPHFPLGGVKILEASTPWTPPPPSYEREQLERDSCINIRLETETEVEGVREERWPWKWERGRERRGQRGSIFIFPRVPRVEWRQRRIVLKDAHTQIIS